MAATKKLSPSDYSFFDTSDFEDVYSWQQASWQRLTRDPSKNAHALLFAGRKGTGKFDFAKRIIAWLLCEQSNSNHNNDDASNNIAPTNNHACGNCQSCHWLKANTHPSFLHIKVQEDSKSDVIKVDDVRVILPFTQQSSAGRRIVFIERAECLNISSANALLKTLEEPPANVIFILTSNFPQQLLPTIKSRVQMHDVSSVPQDDAINYVENLASFKDYCAKKSSAISSKQLLAMSGNAPLMVSNLLDSSWLHQRQLWLTVWQALRAGQRDVVSSSQYWQKQMSFEDACTLQRGLCLDLMYLLQDLPAQQTDLDYDKLDPLPTLDDVSRIERFITQSLQAKKQHIQDSYLYDKLLSELALI